MTIQDLEQLHALLNKYHFEYHNYKEPTTRDMILMVNESIKSSEEYLADESKICEDCGKENND